LQALGFLRLFGEVAHDDVLQHVGSLSRLQQLVLVDGMFTLASFQQLPQSLTHLCIDWAGGTINTAEKNLTASTAPGLCALTGLQELYVQAGPISVEVLANMTSLKFLSLSKSDIEAPGALSVLTALTQLTYLALPPLDIEVIPSVADVSAVTASSHLHGLDISGTFLTANTCQHLFPVGRQLLQLTHLCASLDLIHDGRGASRVAACCPNLASIILVPGNESGWAQEDDYIVAGDLAIMLVRLQPLQHLTRLTIETQDLPMLPEVWRALARLTQLRELKVNFSKLEYLAGVLNLTRCTQLRSLCVDTSMEAPVMERVWLDVTGEEVRAGGLHVKFN
jgi:Leucine-rich repeat (LRR) protein